MSWYRDTNLTPTSLMLYCYSSDEKTFLFVNVALPPCRRVYALNELVVTLILNLKRKSLKGREAKRLVDLVEDERLHIQLTSN